MNECDSVKSENQQMKMQILVEELMKDQPNKKIVKKLVKDLNIPQSSDLLVQTSNVLLAINEKRS